MFCLPSRFEGFGLAALEAMLAARVLLVSERAGIARHVAASGCGVAVAPTVEGVREGLDRLLRRREHWREMGLAGRRHALRHLRWLRLVGAAGTVGCGGLEAIKEIYDVLGTNTVFVNAAGCMTLLSVYPFTPFRGSWLYTAMASAPAGAQGGRDALDILMQTGRMKPEDDLQGVTLTGEGAAYGMGLSATSGAIDGNLDFP